MEEWNMDAIYFEDGERVRKKEGFIKKIDERYVHFIEEPSKEYMIIPTTRIVRIVKGKEGSL
jgi:hypothetical protein